MPRGSCISGSAYSLFASSLWCESAFVPFVGFVVKSSVFVFPLRALRLRARIPK